MSQLAKGVYFLEKEVQILIRLGLSVPQARIYCLLARMQNGTSATIATAANLARQQVYREMPYLLEFGLVEKIIATPTKYRATPINTCIKILKRRRSMEFSELQQAAENFLKEYDYRASLTVEEPFQFVIASEKEIASTQVSIEAIGPARANEDALLGHNTIFRKKNKQGVKIRLLNGKLRKSKEILETIGKLKETSLFEIGELPNEPPVQLAIHDRKRVDIIVPNSSNAISDLWTNHPSIVTLAITYFEEMWNKATKI